MEGPQIAIVEKNTLTSIGLESLLEEIIPMAVIRTFSSFEALIDDTPDMYAHYFISAAVFIAHTSFFLPRRPKTIILGGESLPMQLANIPLLNIYLPEKEVVKEILKLHNYGHNEHHPSGKMPHRIPIGEHELSQREREVLILITQGLINKQIAERLNISLNTVITHRKNITEKLGFRSVSALTIYAVVNGFVDIDKI